MSTKIITRDQHIDPKDPTAGTMKIMNVFMPIMMGVMTFSLPAALGLYWTLTNIIQVVQTLAFKQYFKHKDKKEQEAAQ